MPSIPADGRGPKARGKIGWVHVEEDAMGALMADGKELMVDACEVLRMAMCGYV